MLIRRPDSIITQVIPSSMPTNQPSVTPTLRPVPILTQVIRKQIIPSPVPTTRLTIVSTIQPQVSTPYPTSTSIAKLPQTTIEVWASADIGPVRGYPYMTAFANGKRIYTVNNLPMATVTNPWRNVYKYNPYSFIYSGTLLSGQKIQIWYTNDYNISPYDRNLRVEKIIVKIPSNPQGQTYYSYDPLTYSTGTYTSSKGCTAGYKQSTVLHCAGYFQYIIK